MICPHCGQEHPDNAKFCGVTGKPIYPAEPIPSPPEPPRRLPILRIAAGLMGIVVLGLVAKFIFDSLGQDQLLYTIQDDGPAGAVNAIAVFDSGSKTSTEIAHDNDGLVLPTDPISRQQLYLAPNDKWLAYYERSTNGWELMVATIDGTSVYSDKMALQGASLTTQGFSPNGRLYAYTTYEETGEDVALHVINDEGAEILNVPNAVFANFFPDSNRILAYQADTVGRLESLVWIGLNDGAMNVVTDLAASYGWIRPLVSSNGQDIYYYEDEKLVVTGVDGGPAREIFEFDSESAAAFYSPNKEVLTIYDQISVQNLGELTLVGIDDKHQVRIDEDVNMRAGRSSLGEAAVAFSSRGDRIAYLTDQGNDVTLYVATTDGKERSRITSNNGWVSFAFSPDGRRIAYIEGDSSREPGNLYIANRDGSEKSRLAIGVWSFVFAPNGGIVYSKVANLSRGNPESELYEVRATGKDPQLLLEAQDGVITLLDWVG